jgi:hypothetical protein
VVVGEQDELLHVLGRGAGVVLQAGQREVGAQAVEQGQRPVLLHGRVPDPVGDLVADEGQVRGREEAGDVLAADVGLVQVDAGVQHVGIGDLLAGPVDLDLHLEVVHQQGQLLDQIVAELIGLGDRGGVDAGPADPGVRARQLGRQGLGIVDQPQLGIGERAVEPRLRVGPGPMFEIGAKRGPQGVDGAFIFLIEPLDRGDCFFLV